MLRLIFGIISLVVGVGLCIWLQTVMLTSRIGALEVLLVVLFELAIGATAGALITLGITQLRKR